MPNTSNIGPNITRLREAAGMSKAELGRRLDCSREFIHKLEAGTRTPNVGRLLDLADILGVTTDDLVRDDEQEGA